MTNNDFSDEFDLDALVPRDIDIKYRGERYSVPGDIPVKQVFTLFRLYQDLAAIETSTDPSADEQEKAAEKLQAGLLELFRLRHPELESLPFGAAGLTQVAQRILLSLGVMEVAPAADPLPNRQLRRAAAKASTRKPSSKGAKSKSARPSST